MSLTTPVAYCYCLLQADFNILVIPINPSDSSAMRKMLDLAMLSDSQDTHEHSIDASGVTCGHCHFVTHFCCCAVFSFAHWL